MGLNGYCLLTNNGSAWGETYDFLYLHPLKNTSFSINPSSEAIYISGACHAVLDMGATTDGTQPCHIESESDCNNPKKNEKWSFQNTELYFKKQKELLKAGA